MKRISIIIVALVTIAMPALSVGVAYAQAPAGSEDLNSTGFRLVICDGPAKANVNNTPGYVTCDFKGLMTQAQHLINIMIIFGVVGAMLGFAYAGYLYITGVKGNIDKAHEIFPKVFWGFIIMLTAWFIVYQILQWLTGPTNNYLMQ